MEDERSPFDQGIQHLSGGSVEAAVSNDQKNPSSSSSPGNSPPSSSAEMWKTGGSLAERRAAKCGFNASKIVARFKTSTSIPNLPLPVPTPPVVSPFLTIPPGLSPAALLESPIMLPNTQAQLSPTTGTFQFPSFLHDNVAMLSSLAPAADGDTNSVIKFSSQLKPQGDTISMSCVSTTGGDQPSPRFNFLSESQKTVAVKNCATDASVATNVVDTTAPEAFRDNLQPSIVNLARKQTPQKREHTYEERGKQHILEVEKKGIYPPPATVPKSSDDGYNWRKYGQKHVKGSEYPRSYFKCTHPNCPVKKKVERSHDGEITEIVYKGVHNHPKSQTNGRTIVFGTSHEMSDASEGGRSCFRVENGMVCRNMQTGYKDIRGCSDWRADGLEGTSSTSVLTESSDPLSSNQAKSMGVFESGAGTPDLSSTLASHDGEDEDRTTQGSTSFGDDGDGDESEAKRRKKGSCSTEAIGPSRSTREPKVVVQIESEIDVLDDGYRWRKYGQKVVKGNPNPRSYYKCTSAGCPVRKHVERASDNLKSVITTYEGKHNHEVPSKTNTPAANCNIGNLPPAASNAHSAMALTRNVSNLSKPGIQIQDYHPLHFETKPGRGNGFMRTNLLGNIVSDMAIGASSIYQLTFPALANPLPYNPFLINANPGDICLSGNSASLIPNSSMGLPLNLPGSSNVALGSYHFNNYAGPNAAIQSSFGGGHQHRESDARLIKPKEEHKDDNDVYDTCLSITDQDATSSFFHFIGNYSS